MNKIIPIIPKKKTKTKKKKKPQNTLSKSEVFQRLKAISYL
jgi:hypothetical protein